MCWSALCPAITLVPPRIQFVLGSFRHAPLFVDFTPSRIVSRRYRSRDSNIKRTQSRWEDTKDTFSCRMPKRSRIKFLDVYELQGVYAIPTDLYKFLSALAPPPPPLSMDIIRSFPVNLFARLDASLFIAFLFTCELQALHKGRVFVSFLTCYFIPAFVPRNTFCSSSFNGSFCSTCFLHLPPFSLFPDTISVPPHRLSVLLKQTLISSLPRESSHPRINLCFPPFKRPMFPPVVSRRTPNSVCSSASSIFSSPSRPCSATVAFQKSGEKSYLSFIGVGSRRIIAKEKRTRKGERDNLSTQNGPGSKNARRGNNRTTIVINEPR